MNKRNPISFKLVKAGKVLIDFGYLYWPWPVRKVVDNGGILVEIHDARNVSVVSLDDITLADLEHS
jgi:hypothetical protein